MLTRIAAEIPAFFTTSNALFLLAAVVRTLVMTVAGCGIGFTLGLLIAVVRESKALAVAPLRVASLLYVETFRRVPFLVVLIILLFASKPLLPGSSLLLIATIAVTLVATAFLSEIIRAGLQSVPHQQTEGAMALNFTPVQTLFNVVLPQSLRVVMPPTAAFVVMFIKDTSLASYLGVVELTFSAKILVNKGFSPVLGFGSAMILYFAISYPLSRLAAALETHRASARNP